MAEGRDRAEWARMAPLIAAVCNSNPFREDPVTVQQINPYLMRDTVEDDDTGPELSAADVALMLCGQSAIDLFAEQDRKLKERAQHGQS